MQWLLTSVQRFDAVYGVIPVSRPRTVGPPFAFRSCTSASNCRSYSYRRKAWCLMFPDSYNAPSSRAQTMIGVGVPELVTVELSDPPGSVCLRVCTVYGTAVPKAAIDENCDLRRRKHYVGSPSHSGDNGHVQAIPKTHRMKCSPQKNLRTGVPLAHCLHTSQRLGG